MIITDGHLQKMVGSIKDELILTGISLDSDLMSILSERLSDFFTEDCDIKISDTPIFDDIVDVQWLTWMQTARELKGSKGLSQSSETTELQAKTLYEQLDGVPITSRMSADSESDNASNTLSFSLIDMGADNSPNLDGQIDFGTNQGIAIGFNGYGDFHGDEDNGTPLYIEWYGGDLRVMDYADINTDEPTHVISLKGAHKSYRKEEEPLN